MLRIVVRAIGFTAAFALLIAAARVIGSTNPPQALATLHLTDCQLPCWLGITPGKTSLNEAVERMKAAYPQAISTTDVSEASLVLQLNSTRLAINIFADQSGVVDDMLLYTYAFNGLAMGDVVSLFKDPIHLFGTPPLVAVVICPSYLIGVSGSTAGDGWQRPLAVLEIQDTNVGDLCSAPDN